MGAARAAAPVVTGQQQQQPEKEAEAKAALFASKHAELLSEARDVAREHGVTVRTVAFRPDGTAVAHDLIGVGREERLRGMVGRAVARDVSAMGPREVVAHHRQLHALRAVVLRELQAKKTAAVAEVTTNKDDDTGTKKTKREMEQPEMDGAGAAGNAAERNKARRTD